MNDYFKIKKVDDLTELEQIILKFDECFTPTLSERLDDLYLYTKKIYINAITIKAIIKDQIVGFASFYCNDNKSRTAYLTQIAVLADVRGQQVGKKLLEEVIEISISNNMKYLKLEVFNNNENAINFYKKYGFYEIGYASDSSKYMIKELEELLNETN